VLVAADGVEKLARLEREGKLLSLPEHLDYEPPARTA
jgi:hypothetical protein